MSMSIKSKDWSALVFAQKLRQLGIQRLKIELGASENSFDIKLLWGKAAQKALEVTRFGRVGFLYDEENQEASDFVSSFQPGTEYNSEKKSRLLKDPSLTSYPTQILCPMAELGWESTVEFRRIARKYIRPIKHAQVDTLILMDPFMGAESVSRVMKHLVGTQIQIITLSDVFELSGEKTEEDVIKIKSNYPVKKIQKQSQRILKRKVSVNDIEAL